MPKRPELPDLTPPPPGLLKAFAPFVPGPAEIADALLLPLDQIDANPLQPRQVFDAQAQAELSISIREHGVLQPILVRPVGDRYQVVVGERRLRAARLAGETTIPALVRDLSDTDAAYATAVENLQREGLDMEDEARQFAHLLAVTGLSERALADRLGIGFNYLSRRVRLLQRPALFAEIRAGRLTLLDAMKQLGPEAPAPPDAPAAPTERAAEPVSARYSTPAPAWRWRPLESARQTLRRLDPASVPRGEVGNVRLWLADMERLIADWRDRLPPPDVYDPTPRPPDPRYRQTEQSPDG